MASHEEQQRKRTPFSARIPQAPLDETIEVVEALYALGAASTPHVIAQQMQTSYQTDARFRTRLGAAGYYGFIRKEGRQRALTPRGEAVVSGDAAAAEPARREAVMSSAFGPIIHSLRGRPVNENTIALRLGAEYEVPQGTVARVARVLVESATQAGLMTDGRLDAAAVEALADIMPSRDEQGSVAPRAPKTPRGEPERKEPGQRTTQRVSHREQASTRRSGDDQSPFVPNVQVVVKVEASNLTPVEIAELVRALQAPSRQST
jgi:hypothetical protein